MNMLYCTVSIEKMFPIKSITMSCTNSRNTQFPIIVHLWPTSGTDVPTILMSRNAATIYQPENKSQHCSTPGNTENLHLDHHVDTLHYHQPHLKFIIINLETVSQTASCNSSVHNVQQLMHTMCRSYMWIMIVLSCNPVLGKGGPQKRRLQAMHRIAGTQTPEHNSKTGNLGWELSAGNGIFNELG
jgi:hypothetical protein